MFLLFAMTCVLFFARLDHPLLEPEEGRYAEIPRQMLAEGRWLTPVLHGEDYWQKPPLLYWLVMLSYQAFGVYDWAARLVPCLAGIASVIVVTLWGWRTLGFWTGFVAGAMLSLSARFLYLAGMLSTDGLLCTFVLAGLAAGHLAMTEGRTRVRWSLLASMAMALGVLTKGPLAILLIAAPLAALALLDRRCRAWSVLESCVYLSLVALVAAPWFVMMAWNAPQAAESFLLLHHLARYLAPLDHEKPAWFYLPSLALGMLPWTLLLIPALPYLGNKSLHAGKRRPAALGAFVVAFAWCVAFFSLSGCKRPAYILPAFPLLALMLGTFVAHGLPWRLWMQTATRLAERSGHRWARRLTLAACAMGVTCSAAAALAQLWPWQNALFLAIAFAALAALISLPPTRMPAWTSWAGCVAIMFFFLFIGQRAFLPDYHDRFGLRRQVEISAEHEQEEELPILTYPKRWDSVSFYTRRNNVESYTPAQREKLIRDLQTHGKAIVFLKRDESLQSLLDALPTGMEIEFLGRKADYVAVGLVKTRMK
jgi:dolichol-phosphate mannosyltransferase